ncbi:MAG TPA: zinc-binding dehydrogenase [Bacteroidales bacterium]|nr:zinc-binding dehydrogenase [Bacteroidales bacterium]
MKAKAVRLYGKKDLRLEEFDLPPIGEDEILAQVISDSICMSTYKAAIQGTEHKRVPADIALNPIITGHEFAGIILEVGKKWQSRFRKGQKFSIQPALNVLGTLKAPGYSFRYIGGNATHVIIPPVFMETDNLLVYEGDAFFPASLSEPMSCIIGAFHSAYHVPPGTYEHKMDIREGGIMAIIGGAGPMGLGAIDYALHRKRRPRKLVVTDIDEKRLSRASSLFTADHAAECGIELHYVNTSGMNEPQTYLRELTGGSGYDDVFIFTPVREAVEQGNAILGSDGCLNFFAGPADKNFLAEVNFYNIHYSFTHIMGTSGGNTSDMKECLDMMSQALLNPAVMITHVGGLDAAADTTLNLPFIPGGKKLIYTNISMPLVALEDLAEKSRHDIFYEEMYRIVSKNNNIWSVEAEKYLLENAKPI